VTTNDFFTSPVARSIPFDNTGTEIEAENVRDAILEVDTIARDFVKFSTPCIYNGNLSDGVFIGYNNLIADKKIIFPVAVKLTEVTWSNTRINVSFDLKFYKNGTDPGDLFRTFEIRINADGYGYYNGFEDSLAAGDYVLIEYIDQGTDANDMSLVLWGTQED
jgi:hypothetical protein